MALKATRATVRPTGTLFPSTCAAPRFRRSSRLMATEAPANASQEELRELWDGFRNRQRGQARLSIADTARTLVHNSKKAMLSVISAQEDTKGFPIGSIVTYAADADGKPILCVSELAPHTRSMRQDGRVSLVISEKADMSLRFQKVTLTGTVEPMETETDRLREVFTTKNPDAVYVDFGDFRWFKIADVKKAHFVVDSATGTARTGTVKGTDYLNAVPDPVAPFSISVCAHMNSGHSADNMALAEAYTGFEVDSANFLRVDRLGIDLDCVKAGLATFSCRVAFNSPAMDRTELKARVIEVTNEAHEATGHKYKKSAG